MNKMNKMISFCGLPISIKFNNIHKMNKEHIRQYIIYNYKMNKMNMYLTVGHSM